MILVTGATGHLGTTVVNHLLKKLPLSQLAVLVRDESKAAHFKAQGISVRVASYQDSTALAAATAGIQKILLISSSDFHDRFGQHKNVVDAAKKAGVKHVIYTSVCMKNFESSPLKAFLESHYQTESYVRDSGLSYTFLQNSLYAEVIPLFAGQQAVETGIFFPAGDGRVSFAVRQDLGEATANILATEGHENKTYQLTGAETSSFADVAGALSTLSGKPVSYTSPEPEAFVEALKQFGLPSEIIGMSASFAAGIQRGDFDLLSPQLEQFLGRKPTSLKAFLKATYLP